MGNKTLLDDFSTFERMLDCSLIDFIFILLKCFFYTLTAGEM